MDAEGSSTLRDQARRLWSQAVFRREESAKVLRQLQWERAGPNPIVLDAEVQRDCVEWLAKYILVAASAGNDYVVIPYLEVPAVAKRWEAVKQYSQICDKDLRNSVDAIKAAFQKAHPEFGDQPSQLLGQSFRFDI